MASLGVLFAIDDATTTALLDAEDDDERMAVIERIEEAWDKRYLAELDKAWDALHRLLSDGTLDVTAGTPPLNRAILGGKHLYEDDDYIIVFVDKARVREVAAALAQLDDVAVAARYDQLVPRDYAPEYGDEDRTYTVENFRAAAALYARAAEAGRAVIFTAGQ